MSHALSVSKVDLALICAYGFREDVQRFDRPSGIEARIGTGSHSLVEDWFHGRPARSLGPDIVDKATRHAAQAIKWLEPRRPRILFCEIGMRYDAEQDRGLDGPRRGEDGYGTPGPMELPGTLDLVLRGEDGVLEVLDLKTGQKKYAHEEQIYTQGLAMARKLNETRVRVGFLFAKLTKCDEPEMRELDENALDVHAGVLHGLMRSLPMAKPEPGEWCWRCDARPGCPAHQEQRASESATDLEQAGYFG